MKIGDLIRYNRKKKKLSQKELAKILNVHQPQISWWERNLNEPRLRQLQVLCDVLEFDIGEHMRTRT